MIRTLLTLLLISPSLLMANDVPSATPPDSGLWQTLIMIFVALTFFYLILWRPEQKRRKEVEGMRQSLKKGDRVVAMGIIGIVSKVGEHTVVVRMVDGAKVEFVRAAISEVVPEGQEPEGNPTQN